MAGTNIEVLCLEIAGGVLALLVLVYFLEEYKRRAALSRIALTMGFSFIPAGDILKAEGLSQLPLFSKSFLDFTKAKNVLRGNVDGVEVALFDYRVFRSMREYTTIFWLQTVAALRLSGSVLPLFKLTTLGTRVLVSKKLLAKRVEFPAHQGFSRRCMLWSPDEEGVRKLFQQKLLDFFARWGKRYAVEGEGNWLVISTPVGTKFDTRIKPEQMQSFLGEATEVLRVFRN